MTHSLPWSVCLIGAQLAYLISALDCAAASPANATNPPAREFDAGFIASRDTTLRGERRSRFFGPFYESRVSPGGQVFRALRPVFNRAVGPDGDHFRTELLWPLAVSKTSGNEKFSRFATMYYTDFDMTDPESAWRLWILPFYFAGSDSNGEDYFALFPLMGGINHIIMMDRTTFFLFPLYARSKRGKTETTDIMWPFISRTTGPGFRQIRILPFYGRSAREGKSASMFLMWPVLTWVRRYPPSEPGGGFIFFPFIGRIYREKAKSWLLLPPLIRWTEGVRFREVHAPWPLVQVSQGKVDKFYLWPLIGARTETGMSEGFLFWPVVRTRNRELRDHTSSSVSVMPIMSLETRRRPVERGPASGGKLIGRDVKLWPLVSYRSAKTNTVLRILDLSPVLSMSQVENNYSPFWTLFSHEEVGDAQDSELLWGLIRRRKDHAVSSASVFPLVSWKKTRENEPRTKLSLIMGLVGYESQGGSAKLRILFFNFGRLGTPAAGEDRLAGPGGVPGAVSGAGPDR